MILLKTVTITGLDDHSNIDELFKIESDVDKYKLEWGILIGTSIKNRYPAKSKIDEALFKLKHCSVHLCSSKFFEVYNNPQLIKQYIGFTRAQLNFNNSKSKLNTEQLYKLLQTCRYHNIEPILQYNKSNLTIINELLKKEKYPCEFLFDSSGGHGITPKEFPLPINNRPAYSGGLSPEHLLEHLNKIDKTIENSNIDHISGFNIDMESGVRTDNILDLDKVKSVIEICNNYQKETLKKYCAFPPDSYEKGDKIKLEDKDNKTIKVWLIKSDGRKILAWERT